MLVRTHLHTHTHTSVQTQTYYVLSHISRCTAARKVFELGMYKGKIQYCKPTTQTHYNIHKNLCAITSIFDTYVQPPLAKLSFSDKPKLKYFFSQVRRKVAKTSFEEYLIMPFSSTAFLLYLDGPKTYVTEPKTTIKTKKKKGR